MTHRNLKTAFYGTVLAGLLGFSSLGFAQSEAIEALNQRDTQNGASTATQQQQYPEANRLAASLDAYNRQDSQGRVPGHEITHEQAPQRVAQEARELSAEIDAYNASATEGLVPETHVPANERNQPVNSEARELAAELTHYNENGGSLASVGY